MLDIQVDEDGELRCGKCGGRHFTEKRTRRAKVIGITAGVATLGIAGAVTPLVAKKKLRCQLCGAYNQTGNAQAYTQPPEGVRTSLLDGREASRSTPTKASKSGMVGTVAFGIAVVALLASGAVAGFSSGHYVWGSIALLPLLLLGWIAMKDLMDMERKRHAAKSGVGFNSDFQIKKPGVASVSPLKKFQ